MKQETIQDEIERKFTLKSLPSLKWDDKLYIDQFYLEFEGRPHRVRFTYDHDTWVLMPNGRQERRLRAIEFIHKESVGHGHNKEHHKDLTLAEANELIKLATRRIVKVRHIYIEDHLKYEIDVFMNVTLIMMEVELSSMEQVVVIPERIVPEVIAEVTGMKGYNNYSLAYPISLAPGNK